MLGLSRMQEFSHLSLRLPTYSIARRYHMNRITEVINAMIAYDSGDVHRINHFLKVHAFAAIIGDMDALDEASQSILEIAALTHDIGIKNSEQKYGNADGNHQQIEGPPEAMRMLEGLSFEPELIERVCWLIAHHHTYSNIIGQDYQILVEADFIVNAFEGALSVTAIHNMKEKIFKTSAGIALLNKVYHD